VSEPLRRDKVVHGDSVDIMERTSLMVDTFFMDWPYSQMSPVRGKDVGAAWRVFGPHSFLQRMLTAARKIATPGAHLYLFGDWRGIPDAGYALSVTGWFPTTIISWDKKYVGTGGTWRSQWDPIYYATKGPEDKRTKKALGNSITVPADRTRGRHPAQKPVELWRRLCAASVKKGTLVLDAFAGSGSSRTAVTEAGGAWYGIDIDKTWAETVEPVRSKR
jgi:DNA modification methylase